jgi:hypothetical protein
MFARVVECQAKDGRAVEISTKVTSDVLPTCARTTWLSRLFRFFQQDRHRKAAVCQVLDFPRRY